MSQGKVRRLIAMSGGAVSMRESELMIGGGERMLDLPVTMFLIEHPSGLALFDTGCNPRVAIDAVGCWGKIADYLHVRMKPEEAVDQQIRLHGYQPEDVKYVIVSHLHLDHAGGLRLFPQAKFFIMKGELNYAYWPERHARASFKIDDLLPTRRFDWNELAGDTDLFGDGSLVMLKTPGHTPGEASLLIRFERRPPLLITGDTVHIRAQLETLAPTATDLDPHLAVDSLRRIKQIRDKGEAQVWVMHDPEDWAELPHVME
jgi:N-acyl homoserine lactone hydrolase